MAEAEATSGQQHSLSPGQLPGQVPSGSLSSSSAGGSEPSHSQPSSQPPTPQAPAAGPQHTKHWVEQPAGPPSNGVGWKDGQEQGQQQQKQEEAVGEKDPAAVAALAQVAEAANAPPAKVP